MRAFVVHSWTPNGEDYWSQIVYRFDSMNELSAKTIAHRLDVDGYTKIEILELTMKPIYRLQEVVTTTKEWIKL